MKTEADRAGPADEKRRPGTPGALGFGCLGFFALLFTVGWGYLAWASAPLPRPEPDPRLPETQSFLHRHARALATLVWVPSTPDAGLRQQKAADHLRRAF